MSERHSHTERHQGHQEQPPWQGNAWTKPYKVAGNWGGNREGHSKDMREHGCGLCFLLWEENTLQPDQTQDNTLLPLWHTQWYKFSASAPPPVGTVLDTVSLPGIFPSRWGPVSSSGLCWTLQAGYTEVIYTTTEASSDKPTPPRNTCCAEQPVPTY